MTKRINRSPSEWRKLFAEQQRSGESVNNFCAGRHINANSFYSKRKHFQGKRERFIEIKPSLIGRHAPVVVEAGALRVEVHDRTALRDVVETLRGASC